MQVGKLKRRCVDAGKALQRLVKRKETALGIAGQHLDILERLQESLSDAVEKLEQVENPESQALQKQSFDAGWMHSRRHNEGELLNTSDRNDLIAWSNADTFERSSILGGNTTKETSAIPQEGDIVVDYSGERSIALILPWADSSYRQYDMVAQTYRDLGCSTVIYNSPTIATSEVRAGNAASLLELLDDLVQRGALRIFVHVMSMNGSIMLARLVLLGQGHASLHAICGIVFDSSPILQKLARPDVAVSDVAHEDCRGAMPGILRHRAHEDKVATNAYVAGYLAGYADQLANGMVSIVAFREQWYVDVLFQTLPSMARKHDVPCLALYSDQDRICCKESVEEALKLFQEQGVRLVSKVFHGSSHCGHHRRFPAEYKKAIVVFVNGVLSVSMSISKI